MPILGVRREPSKLRKIFLYTPPQENPCYSCKKVAVISNRSKQDDQGRTHAFSNLGPGWHQEHCLGCCYKELKLSYDKMATHCMMGVPRYSNLV